MKKIILLIALCCSITAEAQPKGFLLDSLNDVLIKTTRAAFLDCDTTLKLLKENYNELNKIAKIQSQETKAALFSIEDFVKNAQQENEAAREEAKKANEKTEKATRIKNWFGGGLAAAAGFIIAKLTPD